MTRIRDIMATMEDGSSPEPVEDVRDWLAAHAAGFGPFIGGRFAVPDAAAMIEVRDPARDVLVARVARGSAADVDAAVTAARLALPAWSAMPGHRRARHLGALARHIRTRERFLAVLESIETGQTIRAARDIDLPLVARYFDHHAGSAEILDEESLGAMPVGVCAIVTGSTSPLLTLAARLAPALAAGNTVVAKPAEFTPLTALAFAEICRDAGLPDGVVNIIAGDGVTGAALIAHPDVDEVAFTGSTEVGRRIRMATAGSGKALSLTLGGPLLFIVFEDADLDGAVEGVVDAVWAGGGQACRSGARLLVQEGIAPRFIAKLKRRMMTLRIGDPLDPSTDVGVLVTPTRLERIRGLVAQGQAEGATLFQAPGALPAGGSCCPPTLVTDVAPASIIVAAENVGPVAAVLTFRTPDEAVALANNTRFGLAATLWTENISLALDCAARVKAGVVWVNAVDLVDPAAPCGGLCESGFAGLSASRMGAGPKSGIPDPARDGAALSTRLPATGASAVLQIRDAVEAAGKAEAWGIVAPQNRARVLFEVAEILSARAGIFAAQLSARTGATADGAAREVEAAVRRIAASAAWADRCGGRVHGPRARHLTFSVNEPFGIVGLVCPDEAPLLAFVSLLMPVLAIGNRAVIVPSAAYPSVGVALSDMLAASGVPAGVVTVVMGDTEALAKTLAEHQGVDALWYVGSRAGSEAVERASASNLKSTWVSHGVSRDWFSAAEGPGHDDLRRATRLKTIWIPYGD